MYINEAKKHLEILLQDTVPVMLLGKPGIGKSAIVKQITAEYDDVLNKAYQELMEKIND